jgi:hypothetical protein
MNTDLLNRFWYGVRLTAHARKRVEWLAPKVPVRELQTLGIKVQLGLRWLEGDFVVWAEVPHFTPPERMKYMTNGSADAIAAIVRDGRCTSICATRRSQCVEERGDYAPASAHWAVKEVL